jgi:hypothetical protein
LAAAALLRPFQEQTSAEGVERYGRLPALDFTFTATQKMIDFLSNKSC